MIQHNISVNTEKTDNYPELELRLRLRLTVFCFVLLSCISTCSACMMSDVITSTTSGQPAGTEDRSDIRQLDQTTARVHLTPSSLQPRLIRARPRALAFLLASSNALLELQQLSHEVEVGGYY